MGSRVYKARKAREIWAPPPTPPTPAPKAGQGGETVAQGGSPSPSEILFGTEL